MKLHWYDSETTGFEPKTNQMLTVAMVSTDLALNTLHTLEKKIKLLPTIVPSPEALKVNQIDPHCPVWQKDALTELEFCNVLSQHLSQVFSPGDLFIAYNAPFDNRFFKEVLRRNGVEIACLATAKYSDPLKLAQEGTRSGKIVTKQKMDKNNKPYMSSSLVDVSTALKTQHEGDAHNAMNDVLTMIKTVPVAYKAVSGKGMEDYVLETKYMGQF